MTDPTTDHATSDNRTPHPPADAPPDADTQADADRATVEETTDNGTSTAGSEAEGAAARRRTRTRRRSRAAGENTGDDRAGAGTDTADAGADEDPATAADRSPADVGDTGALDVGAQAVETAGQPEAPTAEPSEPAEASTSGPPQRIRRRRRGRRGGRGRGGRGSTVDTGAQEATAATSPTAAAAAKEADTPEFPEAAPAEEPEAGAKGADRSAAPTAKGPATDDRSVQEGDGSATRLRSKQQQRRGRGKGRGRRPAGAVSDETRRAINEGPPKRMLVTCGEQRTQIAVVEQRTLVEHFVTRREDTSIVGNIYMGRVQNVLPGMEAAFVDIGRGRNGVLYAGEVDYPADTDDVDEQAPLPRIEQTLKPGQPVLVQVTKDAMGSKGARLTQHLSLAGRFCVLAPGGEMLGISRKLPDEERSRLRGILKEMVPDEFGVIVRTAAEGATREQLEADVRRLTRIWERVSTKAATAEPLEAVYEEPGLVMRVIRDVFGPEYEQLVIDDAELAEGIREYLGDVAPDLADRVAVHEGDETLFDAYEISVQVRRALEKKVWLRSGGYLIIEKTEAMWIIDVNTGKFVGQDNLEETVLRNNLEAAEEIARQLRLRDMGGIIVIDFVDMLVPANRDEVLKRFKRELARDKTKSRVMDISRLGLVQMTRKNVSQGLTETFTKPCETCEGRGAVIVDVFD